MGAAEREPIQHRQQYKRGGHVTTHQHGQVVTVQNQLEATNRQHGVFRGFLWEAVPAHRGEETKDGGIGAAGKDDDNNPCRGHDSRVEEGMDQLQVAFDGQGRQHEDAHHNMCARGAHPQEADHGRAATATLCANPQFKDMIRLLNLNVFLMLSKRAKTLGKFIQLLSNLHSNNSTHGNKSWRFWIDSLEVFSPMSDKCDPF